MIVGSYAGPLAANYFLGNTLETASRIVTGTLRNFQNYTFSVNGDTSTKDPIIDVTGTTAVTIEPAEGDTRSLITVVPTAELAGTYTLISAAAGFTDLQGAPVEAGTYTEELFNYDEEVRTIESLSRVETFRIKPESVDLKIVDSSDPDSSVQELVITFESGSSIEVTESANDETNALMQSSASTFGTLWEASDLLVDTALRAPKPVDGLFAAARSGKYGFDRHPRMDSTNTTGLLGYAMTFGKTQTGVFLEMGHADYETDSPTSTGRVTGDGDHNYAGAGVFVSQELIPDLHATAYVKGGALRNAFDVTIAGKKLDLNRTSAYWGAHLGVHYDWALSQSFDAWAYASYFYDGREKETYKKAGTTGVAGSTFTYDALESHRVQLTYAHSQSLKPYVGLALEQVLKAEGQGSADDGTSRVKLNTTDMDGTTGILSAGWKYVNDAGTFAFSAGVNGYAGLKNGVNAMVQGQWAF